MTAKTKVCKHCHRRKRTSEYYRKTPDGTLRPECKACTRERLKTARQRAITRKAPPPIHHGEKTPTCGVKRTPKTSMTIYRPAVTCRACIRKVKHEP